MVITESELREMWRDGRNPLPAFPPGTSFTPSARDFLNAHQLKIEYAASPSTRSPASDGGNGSEASPDWDRPGAFPVVLTGPAPVCSTCGQPVHNKPENLTQLDAGHFAPKTHPRVKLRGRLDTLHALTMLTASEARRTWLPRLAERLDTLAAYCREIQSAEYNARPVAPLQIAGMTEDEIHSLSHHPDQALGLPHIVPGAEDAAILHWLNFLRTTSREVEILALEVYPPPEREDLARALNRFSSGVYVLELSIPERET